jgi:hypothetical protein
MTAYTCWADPLSRNERRELSRKLARACRLAYAASRVSHRQGDDGLALSLVKASADMSDLHLDVTERAEVPAR